MVSGEYNVYIYLFCKLRPQVLFSILLKEKEKEKGPMIDVDVLLLHTYFYVCFVEIDFVYGYLSSA